MWLIVIVQKFHYCNFIGREGAVLRQMTDGRHMIQLIYDADQLLQDCEYITDAETASRFQNNLAAEYQQLSSISLNTQMKLIKNKSELPEDLAHLAVYRRLKIQCKQLHSRMRKAARQSQNHSSVRYVNRASIQGFLFLPSFE